MPSIQVMQLAGISYRQLHYWVQAGYLTCTSWAKRVRNGEITGVQPLLTGGSGSMFMFEQAEVDVAVAMARMVRAGIRPDAAHRAARNGGQLTEDVQVILVDVHV